MKDLLTVVKLGGQIIDHPEKLDRFLDQFIQLSGAKILVHGGGKVASQVLRQMGIEPQLHNGRRITDSDTLKVVQMVYGGMINKNLVALLQSKNCPAVGLSGVDGNIILARRRPIKEIDFGFVGDITAVNTHALLLLLHGNLIPVIAPLTHDGKGQILNTNADTIACALASALTQHFTVRLIFAFEKPGVLGADGNENSMISELTPELYQKYKQNQMIRDGMLPKIDMAFSALKAGVQRVQITAYHTINNASSGTAVILR